MNINRSLAHSIKHTRLKDLILGFIAGNNTILASFDFILLKNSLYQLVFLAELICLNLMLVYVFIGEYRNLKNYAYVHNLGFLIKSLSKDNMDAVSLEDLIIIQTRYPASNLWKIKLRMAFHNFCCESPNFLVFCCSTLVIVQVFIHGDLPLLILGQVIFLFLITILDTILLVIALIIEMPRRIRLYFRLKKLRFNYEAEYDRDSLRQQAGSEENQNTIQNRKPTLINLSLENGNKSFIQQAQQGQNNDQQQPQPVQGRNSQEIQQQQPQIKNIEIAQQQPQVEPDIFVSFQEIFDNSLRKTLVEQKNIESVTSKKEDEIECPFCCLIIEDSHQKTQLKCHYSHIYHSKCLEDYANNCLDKGLPASCMICRKELF